MINRIFNNQSIFFAITITFLISIILVFISFTVLYKTNEKREKHFNNKRDIEVSKMVLRECSQNGISNDLKQSLQEINFSIITNEDDQREILNDESLKVKKTFKHRMANIQQLRLCDTSLIYINTPRNKIILVNNNKKEHKQYTLFIIFALLLFMFILLYIVTINKLKPLKNLKDKMKGFANEQFDIDCATNKKDEISQLANEFDATARRLKSLKESRNVFIRNIMHELKTPITKGKFLANLPQTEQNIDTMQKVFYRLESLIGEFTTIEELLSTTKVLERKEYFLSDVIDEASDILMCEEDEVILGFEDIKVNIDFKLFSIAIKNLLDNGIKYSKDKKVEVTTEDDKIIFKNVGDKLVYPIENYFEPFFKGDDVKSNQSFGLGLYIVKHILEANNYQIKYIYEDGINIFALEKKDN